jgi:hypothetical protein
MEFSTSDCAEPQFDMVMRKEPVIQEWLEVSTMQGVRDVLPKISSWCVVPVYSFLSTLPSRAFFIPSTSYLHHHLSFYIPSSTKTLNQKDFTRLKPWMGLTKTLKSHFSSVQGQATEPLELVEDSEPQEADIDRVGEQAIRSRGTKACTQAR